MHDNDSSVNNEYFGIMISDDEETDKINIKTVGGETINDGSEMDRLMAILYRELKDGIVDERVPINEYLMGEAMITLEYYTDGTNDISMELNVNPKVNFQEEQVSPAQALAFSALARLQDSMNQPMNMEIEDPEDHNY